MITVKFSFTTLNAWANGFQEDAIGYYLGKDLPKTPAMELGELKHKQFENYINQHKRLPDEVGGRPVADNALVEQFMGCIIPFSDDYQIYLIGKFDLIEEPVNTDWKFGTSEPGQYLDGFQQPYYQLILHANDIDINEGRFVCVNPYTNTKKIGVRYLDEKSRDDALNHVMTFGGEMINYLATEKLIKDYDPNWRDKPASSKQVWLMQNRLDLFVPPGCTAGQASDMISEAKRQEQSNG